MTEVEKVAETVDDGETVLDPDCEMVRVLHGDAVYETDTVPHELADADIDVDGEMVELADPQAEPVTVDAYDTVAFGEEDVVDEIVGDEETDTDPH